jgi:hypothetical protein
LEEGGGEGGGVEVGVLLLGLGRRWGWHCCGGGIVRVMVLKFCRKMWSVRRIDMTVSRESFGGKERTMKREVMENEGSRRVLIMQAGPCSW